MPDLNFEVVGAEAPAFAAVPTLIFKLSIDSAIEEERIFTVALRCQIQINVTRRRYSPEAQQRLLEVFGEPFDALGEGEIPLTFLFSGTFFYEGEAGNLQVGQISWSKEAAYRLPVALWQEMIQRYYPNSAWIRLHKDVFDQLYRYKATHSLPTWEEVVVHLLQASGEEAQS